MFTQFQVGETYGERFICDHKQIAYFTITARTAKTVTTQVRGEQVQRRIHLYDGVEQFKPFGSYSMAMVVGADSHASRFQ